MAKIPYLSKTSKRLLFSYVVPVTLREIVKSREGESPRLCKNTPLRFYRHNKSVSAHQEIHHFKTKPPNSANRPLVPAYFPALLICEFSV